MSTPTTSPKALSEQEFMRLNSLPIREFKFGNEIRRGRYDESTHILYYMEPDGTLSGKAGQVYRKDIPPKPAPSVSEPEFQTEKKKGKKGKSKKDNKTKGASSFSVKMRRLAGATDAEIYGSDAAAPHWQDSEPEDDVNEDDEEAAKSNKKKKFIFGGVILLLVIAIGSVLIPMLLRNSSKDVPVPYEGVVDSEPLAYYMDDNLTESVTVMQAATTIIPGDVLSLENLRPATISISDYNLICQAGRPLYRWNDYYELLPVTGTATVDQYVYATVFLDSGAFLSYNDISFLIPQSVNPWMENTQDYTYITVPVNPEFTASFNFHYGAKINLEIDVPGETTALPNEGLPTVDGMRVQSSSGVKYTYKFDNVVIADVLDKEGVSLYSTYENLASIPAWRQASYLSQKLESRKDFAEYIVPAFIKVGLKNEQVAEMDGLNNYQTVYRFDFAGSDDFSTDGKLQYSKSVSSLVNILVKVKAGVAIE